MRRQIPLRQKHCHEIIHGNGGHLHAGGQEATPSRRRICLPVFLPGKFRRAVKAQNRPAQIVYERADGTIDESADEELPFDINADVIDITDADYAIWYMDAQDNPKKYDGKKIKFLALVYNPEKMSKKGMFVPGRFAMTCCVEDVQFLGFKCKYPKSEEIGHKSWINITAEVHVEFAKEYRGKGPVLYPVSIEPAEKPEDELVYFS